MGGRTEVVQDFAPGTVFRCAAAMAFVDDDQIEELLRELLEQLLPLLRSSDGLIEAQIDLVSRIDPSALVEGEGMPMRLTQVLRRPVLR